MRRFVPPRSTPMEKLLIMEASRVPSGISNFQSCDFSPGGIFLRASSQSLFTGTGMGRRLRVERCGYCAGSARSPKLLNFIGMPEGTPLHTPVLATQGNTHLVCELEIKNRKFYFWHFGQ